MNSVGCAVVELEKTGGCPPSDRRVGAGVDVNDLAGDGA
jgi:hypothetical protein